MKTQLYINVCKDEIDQFTELGPRKAIEALQELEEYARERRMYVEERLLVQRLRRNNQRRRPRPRKVVRP